MKYLNFGQALEALKAGKMVRRSNWNIGTFVFRQVPSVIGADIVPKMQSLPDAVKEEFVKRFNDPIYQTDAIYYEHQLALVDSSNLITGYSPSPEDSLAENWCLND